MNRKVLGRGLSALIPDTAPAPIAPSPGVPASSELPVSRISSNPYQPRHTFDDEKLEELAQSIRSNGVIQPIVVRRAPDGEGYQLIAGERRFLAAKLAGRETIPAVVRQASRKEMLEFALVENLQRENLNPIEEALAYQTMGLEFNFTHEQLAERVGKDRTTITNTLRLLNLTDTVKDMISSGALSTGHARCLLSVESGSEQETFAREIVKRGLSVRQVEELTAARRQRRKGGPTRRRIHQSLVGWEDQLRHAFGTQVRIAGGTARGRIEISYFSEEDLERILEVVGVLSGREYPAGVSGSDELTGDAKEEGI